MAALVFVLMVPFPMNVLVGMSRSLVAMLMAVVAMSHRLVRVLVLMLVLAVAAHRSPLLSFSLKLSL
jgi:hypothetical protein